MAQTTAVPVGSGRGWAYRTAWLVLPPCADDRLAELLNLAAWKSVEWAVALDAVSGDRSGELLMVTPEVGGRRFAVGSLGVFEDLTASLLADDPGPLQTLADELGAEVQYFASHPGADVYLWARFLPGGVCRYVVTSADDGVAVHGSASPMEEALGVDLITGDTDDDLDLIEDLVDETTVFAIARAWSVDPSLFEDDRSEYGQALFARRHA